MPEFVKLTTGAFAWRLDPALLNGDGASSADGLFQPDGPDIEAWLKTGQATVVKQGKHQCVYHVVLPGLDFYLKHYRLPDTRAWLRSLLRPAKARLEFDRTRMAAECGLPTLTPLAAGEAVVGPYKGQSFLVTLTLADGVPLHRFLETTLPILPPLRIARLRQRIAVALGQLLARMHHTGVAYRDLHPGNLLLQIDADDRVRLFLIDVYAVTFGPPLTARASRYNLVILNRWFMLRSERSDRLRAWLAYQEARNRLLAEAGKGQSPRACAADADVRGLERKTLSSNLRFWRHLDKKCLETNRQFRRVHRRDVAGHVVADLEPGFLAQLLDDPDAPFERPDVKRLKHSASATVIELSPDATPLGKPLILKRFAVTKWSDPLASLLRRTPALRSFIHGHSLSLRFLPTPRPLAVLHRQQFGLQREGYLLMEKVEGAVDLGNFVNSLAHAANQDRRRLRELIAQVARLVCTLHQRRLSHRDLKAANLLVREHPEKQGLKVWFIDLVGVVRHLKLRRGRRLQNLARLHTSFFTHPSITRTDKLRFLRAYLRWGLRGNQGWKTWWRRIAEATRDKIARNVRNCRPLG